MKTKTNIRRIIRNSIRLYFAPITGAVKAVRTEVNRINREQHEDSGNHPQHA